MMMENKTMAVYLFSAWPEQVTRLRASDFWKIAVQRELGMIWWED